MENEKLVFIGAGPTNITAIMYLLHNGYPGSNIILVDMGSGITDRPEKELLHGFGGAGTFSDNKNVFSKHKDQPIFDFIDMGDIERYYGFLMKIIKDYHPKPEMINISLPEKLPQILIDNGVGDAYQAGWGEISIKQSTVWHVGSTYGKIVLQNWSNFMEEQGIKTYYKTEFKGANIESKTVNLLDLKTNEELTLEYTNLYLALGKVGKKTMVKFYNDYNVKQEVKDMNLGVRFEIDYDNNPKVQEVVSKQYDFKFSRDLGTKESVMKNIRTFCSCHGSSQVVAEKFEDSIRVNGHGYGMHNKDKWTGNSNFGIMINESVNGDEFIRSIINKYPKGFMVRNNDDFPITMEDELPNIGIDEFLELYQERGKDIMDFIDTLQNIIGFNGYRFYGPEIKESSTRVPLNKNMEVVGLPNIYCCGDSGIGTRGIIPAACSGIKAVENLIKRK